MAIPAEFYEAIILPIIGNTRLTSGLFISTVSDRENFFSRLLLTKTPDGKPVLDGVHYSSDVCLSCSAKGDFLSLSLSPSSYSLPACLPQESTSASTLGPVLRGGSPTPRSRIALQCLAPARLFER